jgi:hypothetical protein
MRVRCFGGFLIPLVVIMTAFSSSFEAQQTAPWAVPSVAQDSARRAAVPLEAIPAILNAFRSHDLVAVGEGGHGNEQSHAFRLALIRDPQFGSTVNDIVVECGNAFYQDAMDRFVRGEEVPADVLRDIWQNTTATSEACDVPIYEEFYRAVRTVNTSLPRERQLRILLGDPPVEWNKVQTWDDLRKWTQNNNRNVHAAELIRREVLAKHRRALIVYGDGHIWRKALGRTIVDLLETDGGTKVFAIATPPVVDLAGLQADVGSWRTPAIAILRGTVLGAVTFPTYYPDGLGDATIRFNSLRMEDQDDALLYLGPPSTITFGRLPVARCEDAGYMEMRLRRIALMPNSDGMVERLKRYCASLRK